MNDADEMNYLDVRQMGVTIYRKTGHPQNAQQGQGWEETEISDTLNIFDNSEMRTPILVCEVVNERSI